MKHITTNSNAYAHSKLVSGKFVGSPWRNIAVEEMYHASDIILKMSIDNHQLGGINAYFSPASHCFSTCNDSTKTLGFSG